MSGILLFSQINLILSMIVILRISIQGFLWILKMLLFKKSVTMIFRSTLKNVFLEIYINILIFGSIIQIQEGRLFYYPTDYLLIY